MAASQSEGTHGADTARESAPGSAEANSLDALRARVLNGTLVAMAVAMPAISVVIFVQALHHGDLNLRTIVLCAYPLSFPALLAARRRLGFTRTALSLLSLGVLTCFLVAARGGAAFGNAMLSVLVITLGTLFFGRRGAALSLVAVVGVFVAAGAVVISELTPPIILAVWDPNNARLWFRETAVLLLLGVAVAVVQVFVVEQLTQQAERTRLAAVALEESRRTETLARLSSGIAHDFNNALTVILGAAGLARADKKSSAAVQSCLDDIMTAAQGAGDLTRQLLTLGRRQAYKPEQVRLTDALRRLVVAAERVVPSDIALELDIEHDDISVFVDASQLDRALFNLVLNARDAMPSGGAVTIRCRRLLVEAASNGLSPGAHATLSVSDQGEGMDDEVRERIFEPFFTTKGAGVGSGLGLATVRGFVEAADGSVQVASTKGQGTTFTLMFPERAGPRTTSAAAAASARSPATTTNHRVLVVEDREDVRKNMVQILTQAGFLVTEASNGDAALKCLAASPDFELMCIDGVMPGTATAVVIEEAAARAPNMRVLLCSGYVDAELLRRGIATGHYPFLQKPFTGPELLESVRALLG